MKPYYQDEAVTLYNADCLEVMKTYPAKSIDLIITDPPYGMKYRSNHYTMGNPWGEIEGDKTFPFEALQEILRIKRNAALIFCRWNNLKQIPLPKSFIVWVKNNWTAGDLKHEYARQWEGIAFYPGENHSWANGRPQDILFFDRIPPKRLQHPTQKPLELIKTLISQNKGATILYPFAGSGTTLLAAKQLGLKAIGIELEEKYCEVIAKRCSELQTNFLKKVS